MDIILNQTIAKVGRAGDIVKVADGYARNFLIPTGMAHEATRANRKAHEGRVKMVDKKSDILQLQAEDMKAKVDGQTITLDGRTAKNSTKLFGAITAADIAAAIKQKLNVDVDKRNIGLLHPIKIAGSHSVSVHLHKDIDANITVEITTVEA
jgi:large subunit ribosomal protein L9